MASANRWATVAAEQIYASSEIQAQADAELRIEAAVEEPFILLRQVAHEVDFEARAVEGTRGQPLMPIQ